MLIETERQNSQYLVDVLTENGDWLSRTSIAAALDKRQLNAVDIFRLDLLVELGEVEKKAEQSQKVQHIQRFVYRIKPR